MVGQFITGHRAAAAEALHTDCVQIIRRYIYVTCNAVNQPRIMNQCKQLLLFRVCKSDGPYVRRYVTENCKWSVNSVRATELSRPAEALHIDCVQSFHHYSSVTCTAVSQPIIMHRWKQPFRVGQPDRPYVRRSITENCKWSVSSVRVTELQWQRLCILIAYKVSTTTAL